MQEQLPGVISFPIPLRIMLASQPQLVTPVLSVIHRGLSAFLIKQAGLKVKVAHTGAVTLMMCKDARMSRTHGCVGATQRFGSAGNLNIHLHCLFLDGVYHLVDGRPVFRPVSPPTEEQLQVLLHQLIQRIMKCLTAEGFLTEDEGVFYMSDRSRTSMCFAAPARPCAMKRRPPIHRLPHCRLPRARTALHWARVRDKKS